MKEEGIDQLIKLIELSINSIKVPADSNPFHPADAAVLLTHLEEIKNKLLE